MLDISTTGLSLTQPHLKILQDMKLLKTDYLQFKTTKALLMFYMHDMIHYKTGTTSI